MEMFITYVFYTLMVVALILTCLGIGMMIKEKL